MTRKRRDRPGAGFALGDGFPAFRRILESDTLPSQEDFFAFGGELRAARLDRFAYQHYSNRASSGDPKYAVWLLLNGMDRSRHPGSDPKNPNPALRIALSSIQIGGTWLYARDELMSLASLLVDELDRRKAAADKVRGRSMAAPKQAKRDPKIEARDKWIYEQCCAGEPHDKIAGELKRKSPAKGWKVFKSKNRVWQIGKEYAERHGLDQPPPRQGL